MRKINAKNVLIHTFIDDDFFDHANIGIVYDYRLDPEMKKPLMRISNGLKHIILSKSDDTWVGCDIHKEDLKSLYHLKTLTGIMIKYNVIEEDLDDED